MDDARPLDAGDPAPCRAVAVREQRVDERPVGVPGRRMDDEAGRLVDDQEVGILVDDVELRCRGRERVERDRLRHVEPQLRRPVPTIVLARIGMPAGGQPTVADELLDVASREAGRVGDVAVHPAGRALGHAQHPDAGHRRGINHPFRLRPVPRFPGVRPVPRVRALSEPGQPRDEGDSEQHHERRADGGVGHVEGVPAEPADPDVDEIDDVAEPKAVDHVADRAAEQQARARSTGTGSARTARGRPTIRPMTTSDAIANRIAWSRKSPNNAPEFWLKTRRM